jgi:hypothetical protein
MTVRYTQLSSGGDESSPAEMEAAFGESDDDASDSEVDEEHRLRRPLVASREQRQPQQPSGPVSAHASVQYDFERIDYDCPPPGSPPRPSTMALPANAAFGNSNGVVPVFPSGSRMRTKRGIPSWLSRWLRLRGSTAAFQGTVGGGADNDGVFSNLSSKPTRAAPIGEDGIHLVPEQSTSEAPPVRALLF